VRQSICGEPVPVVESSCDPFDAGTTKPSFSIGSGMVRLGPNLSVGRGNPVENSGPGLAANSQSGSFSAMFHVEHSCRECLRRREMFHVEHLSFHFFPSYLSNQTGASLFKARTSNRCSEPAIGMVSDRCQTFKESSSIAKSAFVVNTASRPPIRTNSAAEATACSIRSTARRTTQSNRSFRFSARPANTFALSIKLRTAS
jgi:hypothetical protein